MRPVLHLSNSRELLRALKGLLRLHISGLTGDAVIRMRCSTSRAETGLGRRAIQQKIEMAITAQAVVGAWTGFHGFARDGNDVYSGTSGRKG
jgi:hypothetical protein